ncbi:TetR/AcrR family transcriptional regulator [Nocardia jejuensis]|uniref:TetR/AcrR family transcriptional regulator n=1 Tax=Nocardia jejuensis TaxID=328049 RepID=UPI0008331EA9|nr:TetR/AcrR family transcriptional regulator [Nocardia jejuensis]
METPEQRVLPTSVKLMWELEAAGSRGPKRGLSLAQILDAAIAVADAEGYAGLSMSRLAKELGFTTMSLYRYVDSKDTLVELLSDRAIGPAPELPAGTGWRAALEAWAWAEFHAIRRHDWWLDIPMTSPPLGPNNMAWLECGLSAFAAAPIPEPRRLQMVTNLSFYVIGRARFLRDTIRSAGQDEDFTAILSGVLDPERFPAITSALAHQAFDDDDIHWEEADFGFALDRLLDGYEAFVREHGER